MRSRRLACLLLGLWLGAGLLMTWVELENTRSVDRTLVQPSPGFLLQLKNMDRQQSVLLLRYLTAEQHRFWLENWETVQFLTGAFFFLFLLFGTRMGKFSLALALVMLLIVAAQRFVLSPEIISRGRVLDFAGEVSRRDRVQFEVLGYGYLLSDVGKYVVGMILGFVLIWPHRSFDTGQEIDRINKTDYSHINR